MANNYDLNTIQKLAFFDAVRKAPGMYIGSKDTDGLHHLAKEIISNSIDEYLNGGCSKIKVTLLADGGLKVEDNGRGIPIGKKKDSNKTALELCFTEEHAGGKFLNATGESGYNSAGGMHGLGTKCVNALSDKMTVTSKRDGQIEFISFVDGVAKEHTTKNATDKNTGVTVVFYPSLKYLETIEFNSERLKKLLEEFSFLCKGLTFNFYNEKTKEEVSYTSQNGLYDYLEYLNKDKEAICKPFYFEEEDGTYKAEVAFVYNDSYSATNKLYTNNIPQIKGTHLTGFKTALTLTLNAFAREKGWLKDADANLAGTDLEEGQLLVINFKMIDPVFKGQNKEELSSTEGRTYVQKFTTAALKDLFAYDEENIKKVFDKAISARKAREAAKKAKEAVRNNKEKKGLKAKMALSNKFIDCVSKKAEERNLLLVEGLSAGSSAIEARNEKTDCIYMLRGKIISPLKTTVDKILANQEMSDIIKVIGAGFGNDEFDINKMNFNKIVITTDADADGADIELLLITFFFTYMRPLVEAGKLYRAVTPLYIVRTGKEELYFYTEEEMDNFKSTHKGNYDVLRAKGLGELNAIDLHTVCFKNQRFKKITISDAKKTEQLLETLQGQAVAPRKQFIYDNAERLGFDFD